MRPSILYESVAHNYAQSAALFLLWMLILIFALVYHDVKEEQKNERNKHVGRN